jgi:hypothetical protein
MEHYKEVAEMKDVYIGKVVHARIDSFPDRDAGCYAGIITSFDPNGYVEMDVFGIGPRGSMGRGWTLAHRAGGADQGWHSIEACWFEDSAGEDPKEPRKIGELDDGTPVLTWDMDPPQDLANQSADARAIASMERSSEPVPLGRVVDDLRARGFSDSELSEMPMSELVAVAERGTEHRPLPKYVVFEADAFFDVAREINGSNADASALAKIELKGAEVIRLRDILAGPGLHAYAGAAQSMIDGIERRWTDDDISEEDARARDSLSRVRDWAHHAALEADAIRTAGQAKLPD